MDFKGIIASMVTAACFGLLAIYVWRGSAPDAVVVAVISGGLNLILGFYFGHMNGSSSVITGHALDLSNQAMEILAQARTLAVPPVVNVNVPPADQPKSP
jgi:hypothetical protein